MQHLGPHFSSGRHRFWKRIFALLSMLVLSVGMTLPSAQAQSYSEVASLSSPGANPNLVWGDHNQDGTLDLAVVGKGNSAVYTGDGSGGFSQTFSFERLDNGAADWGDFDRDGDLDLVVTGFEPGQGPVTTIYENTGGGTFSVVGAGIVGLSDGSPSWGDYDKDGDLDLLVSGIDDAGTNVTRVYRNDGGGTFVQALDGGQQGGPSAWGDFDGDGDLDFIVTGFYSPLSVVWQNLGDTDGDGETEFGKMGNSIPGVQDGAVAWGDADADGIVELAILGNDGTAPPLRVFDYESGGFVEDDVVAGSERGSVDWGDADNDGDLDLLVTGFNGEVKLTSVYTNDGDGTSFSFATDSFPAVSDGRAAFGDYNDDGILDAAVAGNDETGSNILKVFSGSADRTNRPPQPPDLKTTLDGLDRTLTLEWGGATDRAPNGTGGQPTPTSALTYNVYLRPQGSSDFLRTPEADPASGRRWVGRRGNAASQTSLSLDPSTLSEGTYEWSAQAIDYNYAGSSFPTAGTFTIARTDLGLSMSASETTIPGGTETTVTLTLNNNGSSPSAGRSEVSMDVPSGLVVTGENGNGQFENGRWTIDNPIPIGGSATMQLAVGLAEKSEQTLSATLTATETLDDNAANHTAQTSIDVAEADLWLASDVGAELAVDEQTTATFTLTNTSSTYEAPNTAVDIGVPDGVTVLGSGGDGSYADGTWTVGTLSTGSSATLDLTVQKDDAAPQAVTAQLGATGVVDPSGASATVSLVAPPYGSRAALAFDGSGDYVATGVGGDDLGLAGESFSVGVWVNPKSLQDDRTLLGMDGGTANRTLHLALKGDGAVRFGFFSNDLDTPGGTVTTETWQHLTFVYDAASGERFIYRNGIQVASETDVSSDFQGTAEVLIGRWSSGNYFDGRIDQVRVWQNALTQQQVQTRMNRTTDLSSTEVDGLVTSYRLDAGSGKTAYDAVGGRNGTLKGDPQWTDPSGASMGKTSAVVTDASTPGTLGSSGSRIEADLTEGTGLSDDLTIYRWGAEGGTFITDETVPALVTGGRSNVAWGAWPRGSATSDLTISYGDVSGLNASEIVRLLRRDRPGQAWTVAAGTSHDLEADQFTVTGASGPTQYAVANIRTVDLQLAANATAPEREQGEQTTVTLTLDNTDAATEATAWPST